MTSPQQEKERVKNLVEQVGAYHDYDAFRELEGQAQPLMVNLSKKFAKMHYRFEEEEFYATCLHALYDACVKYKRSNPCFLSYAKTFMLRRCWRELEYWNAEKRNIFDNNELSTEKEKEKGHNAMFELTANISVEEDVVRSEFIHNVEEIITAVFSEQKAEVLRLYVLHDMRPVDIAESLGLHYQNIYSTIQRGVNKIAEEYSRRFLDKPTYL